MNVTITSKKIPISDKFTKTVERELNNLDKFFGDETKAVLTITPIRNDLTLELSVSYNGLIFRAEQTATDKDDAFNAVIDKIVRQIRKNKTKLKKRLRDNAFDPGNFSDYSIDDDIKDEEEYNVVKHKTFFVRPMSVDEAILQMNMLGHEFFMFRNAETGEINVVYVRKDGDYAVLEPES